MHHQFLSFREWCDANRIYGAERLWRETWRSYGRYIADCQQGARRDHLAPLSHTIAEAFASDR